MYNILPSAWPGRSGTAARRTICTRRRTRFDLSVVTYMELVQGMRSKQELRTLRAALGEWSATAVARGVPLLTGNARHYRVIGDLSLEAFRS
ncbi:MAG: hypothetical protein M3409_09500 [Gemmatimonadota bacterium]|nr:hypothetical protein [Gemmatimonadota bacterium]